MKMLILSLLIIMLGSDAFGACVFNAAGAVGAAASGNVTLNAPASPLSDDIWIAALHSSDQVAHTFTDWTQLFQANGVGTTTRLSVWYFRYAGAPPNLIVGHTVGATIVGGIAQLRGCKTTDSPADVVGPSFSESGEASQLIEHTSITPSVNDTLILAINGSNNDNERIPIPTGFTAAFNPGTTNSYEDSAGTPDGSVAMHYKAHAGGVVGQVIDTQPSNAAYTSVLIAIAQATATPTAARRRATAMVYP